jgi:hypothetical protein
MSQELVVYEEPVAVKVKKASTKKAATTTKGRRSKIAHKVDNLIKIFRETKVIHTKSETVAIMDDSLKLMSVPDLEMLGVEISNQTSLKSSKVDTTVADILISATPQLLAYHQGKKLLLINLYS